MLTAFGTLFCLYLRRLIDLICGFHVQESCGICWRSLMIGQGRAIFIAECSHRFHYPCIANNVQYGNLHCPVCRAKWDKTNVPFQVSPPKRTRTSVVSPMLQQLQHWNYPHYPEYSFKQQQQDPPEPLTFADDEPLHSSISPVQSLPTRI